MKVEKIAAIALRSFNSDGVEYAKGQDIALDVSQFNDWALAGLVEMAPPEKPACPTK